MEKIFLDTNVFIDTVEDREELLIKKLSKHSLFVSIQAVSTWMYIYKHSVPNSKLDAVFETFNLVDISVADSRKAALGPTKDFEDNMQLHASVAYNCSIFLTRDKELLKLGYFGKVRISNTLQ